LKHSWTDLYVASFRQERSNIKNFGQHLNVPSMKISFTWVQSTRRFEVQDKIMICESTSFTKHISSWTSIMHFGKVGCLFLRCLYNSCILYMGTAMVTTYHLSSLFLVSKSEDPRCTSFADYILENYIVPDSRFPPTLWSSLPSLNAKRTTKGAESFHAHVTKHLDVCFSRVFVTYRFHKLVYVDLDSL
jgi:hypothetical protein